MPDDRLFHPRLLQSDKVDRLSDFERGIWFVSRLVCDDFGVFRFNANTLQGAARFLERKPSKVIDKAMSMVRCVGLLATFNHESREYAYQWDWQDWQKVTYPRGTLMPKPDAEALALCSVATQELFTKHPGGWGRKKQETFSERSEPVSQTLPKRSENVLPKPLALAVSQSHKPQPVSASESVSDELSERAGKFVRETYPTLYAKHRKGARYVSKPNLDYLEAVELCRVWDDARLEKIAAVFLTTDHQFAESGSRTMAQFRALASWCDSRLQEAGIA